MTLIKTAALAIAASLAAGIAVAGHHVKGEHIRLAAQPGRIMVVYHWPCADADAGLTLIKEIIASARGASPYPYSAAPAVHEDGALVSVDVHGSAESMEKAFAWQAEDATWQAQFAAMEAACGSADDLTTNVLTMQ